MDKLKLVVSLPITADEFKAAAKINPVAAADYLSEELSKFDNWLVSNGNEPLTRTECQILREYLGYKLVISP